MQAQLKVAQNQLDAVLRSPKRQSAGNSAGKAPKTPAAKRQRTSAARTKNGTAAGAAKKAASSPPADKTARWQDVDLGKASLQRPDDMRKALFNHQPRFMALNDALRQWRATPGNASRCFFVNSFIGQTEPHCPYGTKGSGSCKL